MGIAGHIPRWSVVVRLVVLYLTEIEIIIVTYLEVHLHIMLRIVHTFNPICAFVIKNSKQVTLHNGCAVLSDNQTNKYFAMPIMKITSKIYLRG